MTLEQEQLNNLNELIGSLKLAQRAELIKEKDVDLIEQLYVDPLPNNAVLMQIVEDNTVFLVGRKGTGKSTIFARAQDYFRKQENEISVYIDVKTLYGKTLAQYIKDDSIDIALQQQLFILQNFVYEVLKELIRELEKNLKNKGKLKQIVQSKKYNLVKQDLKDIGNEIHKPNYTDASLILKNNKSIKQGKNIENSSFFKGNLKNTMDVAKHQVNISAEAGANSKDAVSEEEINQYSNILLRQFSIKEYMENISSELKKLGIMKAHIFLDDFSEIDFSAQQVFVNTILAPLNNWSNKFFRFKIGCYPNRIFYGDIDKGKVNEINLDYYNLYKVKDLPELEEKAIDFLERLLIKRFDYYLDAHPSIIFQVDNKNTWESYKELLFKVSMNIPRVLGHILNYCYQSATIYNKKITKSLIEDASQKYYESKIAYYFDKTNHLAVAFDETLDRHAQQVLLDKLVDRSKELKSKLEHEDTELFKDIAKNNIPTSHFYVKKEYEKFFYSLELNYFLTKYYEQADRDGITICIYAINYGLCKSKNIVFGRPKGHTKYRKYYISRHFDNTYLLEQCLLSQTKYVCNECKSEYDTKEHEILEQIGHLCYKGCKKVGTIEKKYYFEDNLFNDVNKENLLPEIELDILHMLKENKQLDLYAKLIASELDCSYQLVAKRAKALESKGLLEMVKKNIAGGNKKIYRITCEAERIYFMK